MELETKQTPHQQGRPERKTSDDSENADERNQQKLNLSGSTNTEEDKDWKWCDACQCQFTNENSYYMHIRALGHYQKTEEMQQRKRKALSSQTEGMHKMDCSKPASTSDAATAEVSTVTERTSTNDQKEEDKDWKWCDACQCQFTNENSYYMHIRALGHYQKTEEMQQRKRKTLSSQTEGVHKMDCRKPTSTPVTATAEVSTVSERTSTNDQQDWYYCDYCELGFNSSKSFGAHVSRQYHAREVRKSKGISDTCDQEGTAARLKSVDNGLPKEFTSSTKQHKAWVPARDKDLTPADLTSHSVPSATYRCDVCNVSCTGIRSYNMHLEGQKHRKKSNKLSTAVNDESDATKLAPNPFGPPRLRIQTMLDACKESLVGLDYLTEFQPRERGSEPTYTCDLCGSKMDPRQVISHVTGVRHRRKFMKLHYPSKHEELCDSMKKYGQAAGTHTAEVLARAIALREGRTKIRLKVELSRQEACDRVRDENVMTLHGSLYAEVDDCGNFRSKVSSGPNEPGRYTRWKEEAIDGDTEFDNHSRLGRRFLDERDRDRGGLKRPSSEYYDQYPGDHKRSSLSKERYTAASGVDYRGGYERNVHHSYDENRSHFEDSRRNTAVTSRYEHEPHRYRTDRYYDEYSYSSRRDREATSGYESNAYHRDPQRDYLRTDDTRESSDASLYNKDFYRDHYDKYENYSSATHNIYDRGNYSQQEYPGSGQRTSAVDSYTYAASPPVSYSPDPRYSQEYSSYYQYPQGERSSYDAAVAQSYSHTMGAQYPGRNYAAREPIAFDRTRNDRHIVAQMSDRPQPPWATETDGSHRSGSLDRRQQTPGRLVHTRLNDTINRNNTIDDVARQLMEATGSCSGTQAEGLLQKLTDCMVTSEKDAQVALQVSNALTKALTQYKLKTFLSDVKQNRKSEPDKLTKFNEVKSEAYFDGYSFNQKQHSNASQQHGRNSEDGKLLAEVFKKTSQRPHALSRPPSNPSFKGEPKD